MHIEYLENHQINNLDKINKEIFTGLCQESNHRKELIYYCKTHNKLCCSSCLCKIKSNGNGQHHDCDVCEIKEIKEEKKNKLKENIKYLEESSKNIVESIEKLKEIYEKINESKEEIKLKILNVFTKIRTIINEREDLLLKEVDRIYDSTYFKEDIIKNGKKIPNQIKIYLEKGKILEKDWNDDENNLIEKINDCINIENNIQNIFEINGNIEKCKSKKLCVKFIPGDEQITDFEENIKKFGEVINEEDMEFKFKFKPGNNYSVTNNGLIATKNNVGNQWNCVIVGDKEIPKNKISKWKIKINKNISKNYSDFYIGIGPKSFKSNMYNECWSIFSCCSSVQICIKGNGSKYNNHNEELKEGDIIEVIVDRKLGNLSFAVNGINYGIACSNLPKDEELFPTVVIFEQGKSVEII